MGTIALRVTPPGEKVSGTRLRKAGHEKRSPQVCGRKRPWEGWCLAAPFNRERRPRVDCSPLRGQQGPAPRPVCRPQSLCIHRLSGAFPIRLRSSGGHSRLNATAKPTLRNATPTTAPLKSNFSSEHGRVKQPLMSLGETPTAWRVPCDPAPPRRCPVAGRIGIPQ